MIGNLLSDLRFGVRNLRKNPGFAAVAILTLALGIGANAAIFQILDAMFWKPLPVRSPSELVSISAIDSKTGKTLGIPSALFPQFQEHNQVFTSVIQNITDGISFRADDVTD